MPVHLGSAAINAAYLGASAVDKVYLGANAVYTALAPPSQVTGLAVDSTGDGTIDLSWTSPASDATITDYSVEYTDVQPLTGVALLAPYDSDLDDVLGIAGTATNTPTVTSGGQFGSYADLGAADKLTYSSVSFGSGDYTVEFWVKRTESSWAPNTGNPLLELPGVAMLGRAGTDTLQLYEDDFGSWAAVSGTTTSSIDQDWHHIALVRDGSTLRFYLDGSQVGTMSTSASPSSLVLGASTIYGCRFGIDDLRVSTSAVYPSGTAYTPPTAAHPTSGGGTTSTVLVGSAATSYQLTSLTNATEYSVRVAAVSAAGTGAYSTAVTGTPSAAPTDPDFANVSLLLHMDGSSGSTTFTDSSSNALTVTANGNAQISTTQAKFGQSAFLDGTGDSLSVTDVGGVMTLGTNDFTVEWWFYTTSNSANLSGFGTFLGGRYVSPSQAGLMVRYHSSFSGIAVGFQGVAYDITPGVSPTENAWNHIAVVRDSTSLRLYMNGALQGSGTATRNYGVYEYKIGADFGGAGYDLQGYIDDFRFTNGVARYTGSSYTVPTAAFPNS